MNEEEYQKLVFETAAKVPYLQHLDIKLVELGNGKAVMQMLMREELKQPYGVLHGGATASLIDSTTAFAVIGSIGRDEKATTVDLTVHYLRPVTEGICTCTATIIRAGKRLITVSAEVHNEQGKLIATALSTYTKV
jgi:uncharacterized protein (TIGR00369 family)